MAARKSKAQDNTTPHANPEVRIRVSLEQQQEILDFIASVSDEQKRDIEKFRFQNTGEIPTFIRFAIDYTLKKAGRTTVREWGTGIKQLVSETIAANIAAYEAGDLTNIRAISRSYLVSGGDGKGNNPATVSRWLADPANKEMIDNHHKAMGITNVQKHNRGLALAKHRVEGTDKFED